MTTKDLDEKLAKLKKEGGERAAQRLAEKLGKKYLSAAKTPINIEALALLDKEVAEKSKTAIIEKKKDKAAIAAVNPESDGTKNVIKDLESRGFSVSVFVVSENGFQSILDFYKFVAKNKEAITGKVNIQKLAKEDLNTIEKTTKVLASQEYLGSNAGDILSVVLLAASATRASDIHLEATEVGAKMRLRIDGILHDIFDFNKEFYLFLVSRIKLLSNLKLNISDEPQDGRFTIRLINKDVEIRVATAPAQFGEVVVMRLLDPDVINLSMEDLGLRKDDLKIILAELKKPNGLILNTGPTGSGKTTTLYAFLKNKKTPEIKIITIEDPVEYKLEGIEQTQVDEESGYTFASGLKSILRQDPDVILIGEIRDKDTAEIGIQAALTGHLVFSTVHANSAAGAIPRILDLGVKKESVGPAMNLIIAQRLVRRLCQKCKVSKKIDKELENKIKNFLEALPKRIDKNDYKEIKIFEPKGCEACNMTGFRGRVGIYELLLYEAELEELIKNQAGETAFFKFAKERGMATMQEDGILKTISGITTLEEVENTTGPLKI